MFIMKKNAHLKYIRTVSYRHITPWIKNIAARKTIRYDAQDVTKQHPGSACNLIYVGQYMYEK